MVAGLPGCAGVGRHQALYRGGNILEERI